MSCVVDRVVVCDAFQEPEHYELLPGGRSKLVNGRRPSMRFLPSTKDVRGCGIAGVVGKEAQLFDDLSASAAERNEFVNQHDVALFGRSSHTFVATRHQIFEVSGRFVSFQ